MAGHSKWAGIKHKKAIVDARRGKLFTKLARAITVAAKEGGGDVDGNPSLALAVQKAKDASMPKDNIERAIAKGTGEGADADALEQVLYEGYGPGGVAMLVEATDGQPQPHGLRRPPPVHEARRQPRRAGLGGLPLRQARAARRRRHEALGGRPAARRSRPGRSTSPLDDDVFEVLTEPADLTAVRTALEEAGVELESSEVVQYPDARGSRSTRPRRRKLLRLVDALEDNDDVDEVHANFDVDAGGPGAGGGLVTSAA